MAAPFLYLDGIPISVQEARVLVLNIYGLSYTEMADFLGCKYGTVRALNEKLHLKFEVNSNVQLMRFSLLHGFDINGKLGELCIIDSCDILLYACRYRKLQ